MAAMAEPMPWATVADFLASETYKRVKAMHGWSKAKLAKFVAAYNEVHSRAKRNGADDDMAESSAFGIAFQVARRAASEETLAKAKSEVHYFAAFAPHMNSRDQDGSDVSASEFKFTLVDKSLPFLRALVSGLSFNYNHDLAQEQGVIRDIIHTSEAPPEVQKATDPAIPFLFVASYRDDASEPVSAEVRISPEWLVLDGNEVLPMTFASTHDPLNEKEFGIKRIAAALLVDPADESPKDEPAEEPEDEPEKEPEGEPEPAPSDDKDALAAAAAASAKSFEQQQGSTAPKETSPMPDGDPPITTPEQFGAKVASLTTELDNERKARKAAELAVAAYKAEFETTKKVVDELKAAAHDQAADLAAMDLVREGKATADQATYFASLYKELGKEKFETLVSALPQSTLGAYAIKASSQVVATPEQAQKQRERLAALLREG